MGKASRAKAQRRTAPSTPSRRRLTPARTLAIGLAVALVVAGALIGVSVAGSGGAARRPSSTVAGAAAAEALFRGIPQSGNVLGNPTAPATLVEFGEPQCPICGAWARNTLPVVVRDYVRTGKLKIVYRGISFIQPVDDSANALRAIAAAGAQGRAFQLIDLLYRNQGEEGSGWITDDLLRSLGGAAGVDVERMMGERSSAAATSLVENSARAAAQVMGAHLRTPTFLAGPSGGQLRPIPVSTLDELGPQGFCALLDRMLPA